jgi:hypothetical protein
LVKKNFQGFNKRDCTYQISIQDFVHIPNGHGEKYKKKENAQVPLDFCKHCNLAPSSVLILSLKKLVERLSLGRPLCWWRGLVLVKVRKGASLKGLDERPGWDRLWIASKVSPMARIAWHSCPLL